MKNNIDEFKPNWDWAKAWQDIANEDKSELPQWRWDCNFKLDYDGDLISVSCRFYPPIGHYGTGWDGKMTFYFLGKEIERFTTKLKCDTLQELKEKAEKRFNEVAKIIESRINI